MAGAAGLDRRPGDRAVQAEVAADAAGNNKRPVVALPVKPSAHEQPRIVVCERAEQRGEQAEVQGASPSQRRRGASARTATDRPLPCRAASPIRPSRRL